VAAYNGDKYDPSRFVLPSYDHSHRSKRINVRVLPLMDEAFDEVTRSRKFPFKTKDDVVRWCLQEGLRTLQSMEKCVSFMPLLEMTVMLARTNFDLESFQDFFYELDGTILQLCNSGYQTQSPRRLVKAIEELVLCMSSSRYRNWYLRALRRRWGHLLVEPGGNPMLEAKGNSGGQ
jgi:hypothetical protein